MLGLCAGHLIPVALCAGSVSLRPLGPVGRVLDGYGALSGANGANGFFAPGYAAFIWPRRTRGAWIAATVALHLGIAVSLGLGVFGAVMIVLTVALLGVSPEPAPALTAPGGAGDPFRPAPGGPACGSS